MENIYEEIYQHLIDRGIEDEVVTNFVNEMYDKEKYHDVEVLNEGVLRGLGAAARFLSRLSKTKVGRAGMFGTGAAGLGYAGYLADRPEKKPEVAKAEPAPKTRDASEPAKAEPAPKTRDASEPDTAPATPENNTVADKAPSSAGKKINKVIDKVKKSNDDRKKELERIRGAAALATIGRSKNADKILTGRSTSKNVNSIVDKSYNRVLTGSPDGKKVEKGESKKNK